MFSLFWRFEDNSAARRLSVGLSKCTHLLSLSTRLDDNKFVKRAVCSEPQNFTVAYLLKVIYERNFQFKTTLKEQFKKGIK